MRDLLVAILIIVAIYFGYMYWENHKNITVPQTLEARCDESAQKMTFSSEPAEEQYDIDCIQGKVTPQ